MIFFLINLRYSSLILGRLVEGSTVRPLGRVVVVLLLLVVGRRVVGVRGVVLLRVGWGLLPVGLDMDVDVDVVALWGFVRS